MKKRPLTHYLIQLVRVVLSIETASFIVSRYMAQLGLVNVLRSAWRD